MLRHLTDNKKMDGLILLRMGKFSIRRIFLLLFFLPSVTSARHPRSWIQMLPTSPRQLNQGLVIVHRASCKNATNWARRTFSRKTNAMMWATIPETRASSVADTWMSSSSGSCGRQRYRAMCPVALFTCSHSAFQNTNISNQQNPEDVDIWVFKNPNKIPGVALGRLDSNEWLTSFLNSQ